MRIIQGLNITYKREQMIKECCQKAQEHPFDIYYFIVEDRYAMEQSFFKYSQHLINIEVMTWKQFLKQLMIEHHFTQHRIMTHSELVYALRYILNKETFFCFHQASYPLIEEIIPLIKDYDLYQTFYHINDFSNHKLQDFIHLYTSLKQYMPSYLHLSLEDIVVQCDFHFPTKHIYIEADHLYAKQCQTLFQKIDQYHDLTLLYTHQNDERLLNLPYHSFCQNAITIDKTTPITKQLFLQNIDASSSLIAYTFVASTPYQEVKKVVYTIAQKIIEEQLHYQDFAIIYPDSSYLPILQDTLSSAHLLHNIPTISSCQYDKNYQDILQLLNEIEGQTFSDIAQIITQTLELDQDYLNYFQFFKDKHDTISPQEFKQFFQTTYTLNHKDVIQNQDHMTVCTIDQLTLSSPKHIYILGLNETILPRTIKDTSLLLDEDIHILRQYHISTPLTTTEQLGVHHNDIFKALIQPYFSITFSYSQQTLSGETLLESSLYKQLKQLFHFIPLEDPQYLSTDDYYLQGGLLSHYSLLNTHIQDYLQTKNQPSSLSSDLIFKLYSPTLSVSQIETYNKCPFLYFIQYGLGIYPLSDERLLPNELGNIVHYVLSINIDQDKDIDTLVDHYIQKDKQLSQKIASSSIHQYFIQQLKKDLQITLSVLKRQLDISQFHVFGKERKINGEIAKIQFKGFVDRIDQYQNKIAIIDYKSSMKDIDLNLAMQGFNIQMLIYLKMVTQKYHQEPGAVLYFNTKKRILSTDTPINDPINENDFYKQYRLGGYVIDDESHSNILALDPTFDKRSDIINVTYVKSRNEYKGHILTKEQLSCLLKEIENHIHELYTQIIQGHIAIAPKGSDQTSIHTLVNPCRYCVNHSVCSFDTFYNDYQLVKFLDVEKKLGGEDDAI